MALNTHFLEIYLFILILNASILLVDSLADTPLKTPFDTTGNVTGIDDSDTTAIFNTTSQSNTLFGNLTNSTISNSTIGGDSSLLAPVDFAFQSLAFLWSFIQFLTGGFVFEVLGLFDQ